MAPPLTLEIEYNDPEKENEYLIHYVTYALLIQSFLNKTFLVVDSGNEWAFGAMHTTGGRRVFNLLLSGTDYDSNDIINSVFPRFTAKQKLINGMLSETKQRGKSFYNLYKKIYICECFFGINAN
jgi:hypothetical protein